MQATLELPDALVRQAMTLTKISTETELLKGSLADFRECHIEGRPLASFWEMQKSVNTQDACTFLILTLYFPHDHYANG